MKHIKLISLIIVFIFFSNCSTPYQPKGLLGGYSEELIEDGIYKVKFSGNQHAKIEKVQKYLLYRCAEITIENEYDYFQIIDELYISKGKVFRPETRELGKVVKGSFGGQKFVVVPNHSHSTKSTSYTNMFMIKMVEKITMDNYQTTFDAKQVIEKYGSEIKK